MEMGTVEYSLGMGSSAATLFGGGGMVRHGRSRSGWSMPISVVICREAAKPQLRRPRRGSGSDAMHGPDDRRENCCWLDPDSYLLTDRFSSARFLRGHRRPSLRSPGAARRCLGSLLAVLALGLAAFCAPPAHASEVTFVSSIGQATNASADLDRTEGLFTAAETSPPGAEQHVRHQIGTLPTKRSRLVTLDVRLLDNLRGTVASAPEFGEPPVANPKLRLNLFGDASFVAVIQRSLPVASGYVLRGRLMGGVGGRMTLAVRGGTLTGTVLTPGVAYTIRTVSRGRYEISEVDRSMFPPDNPEEEWNLTLPPDDAPADRAVENHRPDRTIDSRPPSSTSPQVGGDADLPTLGNEWVPVGPAPILDGQVENVEPENEVAGAVHTVLAHPTDADVLYIGAVNGGIWRTDSATDHRPYWRPLTDHLGSLSIGAMAFDPNDPHTILAGIGAYSSYYRVRGGRLSGLLKTQDGGDSWSEITVPAFADPRFAGWYQSISGVSIHGNRLVVSAGRWLDGKFRGGIFLSNDSGVTWIRAAITAHDEGVMDLVEVSADPNRFFASIQGQGIFRTDDGGVSWRNVSRNDNALNAAITDAANNNAEMAVAGNGRLYVGILVDGQLAYIGFTDNQGATWSSMDLPRTRERNGDIEGLNPRSKPGAQGYIHFSIRAHPTDHRIIYVGGDRQDVGGEAPDHWPNFIGATDYTGRLFRGNTNVVPTDEVPSPQWEHLTHIPVGAIPGGGTASGSAPHADSREMVFDARGDLIEVNDGGVYRRTSPEDNTGDWFSLNGNLQVTEIHDIAYDPVSNIVISGNQDTGTTEQNHPGNAIWRTVAGGDGGDVAVDVESSEHSIRYSSYQYFRGFRRITVDASNREISREYPTLRVDGVSVYEFSDFSFRQSFELNAVNRSRGVFGSASTDETPAVVYETHDRFDTLQEVRYLGPGYHVYGKAYGCAYNDDLLYIGLYHFPTSTGEIFVRTDLGDDGQPTDDDFETTGYPATAGRPYAIVVPSDDCETVYVVDGTDVWVSNDAGDTWRKATGNLPTDTIPFRIEFIPPGGMFPTSAAIAVAGYGGVRVMSIENEGVWFNAGFDLPNAPVWDLDYDRDDDAFFVGTMGRGAWRLNRLSHGVPLFPSTSDSRRQGFVRVINHANEAGDVRIDAFDDAGSQYGPLTLGIDAGEAVHFNSGDLETGNPDKELEGATGSGEGNWRLELTSDLNIEALAYIRTRDGFLTSMYDLVPYTEAEGGHRVAIFNPGSNVIQVSQLRLINPGAKPAEVVIRGIDDAGESPGTEVRLSVPAKSVRTVTARELESGEGEGLSGALGDGKGKWELVVTTDRSIQVMSLLSNPTGHLTNLSTAPVNAEFDEAGGITTHLVPLFPSAIRFTRQGIQGFVRVINYANEAGDVHVDAFDDTGSQYGPLTLSIDAYETVHLNSGDLELGNTNKGLSGGLGKGTGDWWLNLRSNLDIKVLSYIRTHDGFVTSMHDLVPYTEAGGHRVAIFNPGKNTAQVSRLRLINPSDVPVEVVITGVDDRGASPGSAVRLTMNAGASRTVTARELESGEGEGLSGALGDGKGKWRLTIEANTPIYAMSLLSSPTGHLTNLSAPPP